MRDVVIFGGGLTGLVAAYELEQHDINYTLIEVKRHLGGSIGTVQRDGYTMDTGAFALADTLDAAWLASLGLDDSLFALDENSVAFKHGTGTLIDALAANITAPRMMRMAVSSIGETDDGRYSICMENGLVLDAGAIIVAMPARYAERLFYGYITLITEMLMDYHYDTVQRVTMAMDAQHLTERKANPPDMAYVYNHATTSDHRAPQGKGLIQFGVRFDRQQSSDAIVKVLCDAYDLPQPDFSLMSYWAEADALSCHDDEHAQWVADIRAQLPDGIYLVGSDYCLQPTITKGVSDLHERIQQGRNAAQHAVKRHQGA